MKRLFWIPILALCFTSTGCLKSRYSLKGDDDDAPAAPKSMQAKVEAVQPAGGYEIEELKSEITRLAGRIEDLERDKRNESGKVNASTREELKKLESRIAELEQAQVNMIEAIKKIQETPPPPPADTESYLDKGKSLYEAGKFEGAIDAFTNYLKGSKPKKAEQATFLRAESFYKLKQYKKAIVDYSKFPEKYIKSSFMPQALYKIGLSFDNLGMNEDAKGFYQEVVEKFPKSAEGKKARAKLK